MTLSQKLAQRHTQAQCQDGVPILSEDLKETAAYSAARRKSNMRKTSRQQVHLLLGQTRSKIQ